MTKTIYNSGILILLAVAALMAGGCVDDFRPGFNTVGEGESEVNVTVSFDAPASVSLESRSGVGSGDVMDGISDFHMVIYHENTDELFNDNKNYKCIRVFKDGEFAESTDPDFRFEAIKYELTDNRLPSEGELQNDATGRLMFKLFLESARYRVYGVANIPDLDTYDLSSPDKLKAIERTWLKGGKVDLAANSEMFGIFSVAPNRNAPEQAIPLQAGNATMHCWLRRLASKLTVSFDGSELFDDVQIFVTDIKVYDVAKKCQLGYPNTPGRDLSSDDPNKMLPAAGDIRYTVENGLVKDGGSVTIQSIPASFDPMGINPDNYIHICNNTHPYLSNGDNGNDTSIRDDRHKTDATSFYFYENLQGIGDSKFQDADGDGIIDTPNWEERDGDEGWKDKKPYGTWVEVSGWYRCGTAAMGSAPHLGGGPIKFRFMLGADTENDYNVSRNHHYKLTLKFKGYGNDADWHIQYKEETGIYAMTPQYISYLYNKKMMSTVKIMGKINPDNPYLYATIVGTDNLPTDFPQGDPSQEDAKQTWWRPWGDGTEHFPDPSNETDRNGQPIYYDKYINDATHPDGPWNSFLTLREVQTVRLAEPDQAGKPSWGARNSTYNRTYFRKMKSGFAKYDIVNPRTDGHDEYTTTVDGRLNKTGIYTSDKLTSSGSTIGYVVNIPFYTRAKELITNTGFTGNNPYSSYPRRMQVRFSISLIDPDTGNPRWYHTYVHIIQVRRIENPKGIWRRAGSTEGFHVTLMRMKDIDGVEDYEPFRSEGKWSAEVIGDPIITLSTTTEGSGDNIPMQYVRHIEGMADKNIDFQINFTGATGFAAVKVRYHNYTCEHDIFCRNGYDPVALADGSYTNTLNNNTVTPYRKWSSFNVYSFKSDGTPVYTNSPIDPGSMFRRGSYTAILPSNDEKFPTPPFTSISESSIPPYLPQAPGKDPSTGDFEVLTKGATSPTLAKWDNIKMESPELYNNWKLSGSDQIATIDDYYTLANPGDPANPQKDLDFAIKKAYGVVYADGAIDTQRSTAMAHGYTHADGTNSPKGMRGIIIYNKDDLRQIFLPMGASGYGRRKGNSAWSPSPKDVNGTMRYATRTYYYNLKSADVTGSLQYAPLFYDIFRRQGALYWCRDRIDTPESNNISIYKSSSFDINYFTMGFEGFENGAANKNDGSMSDAIFIRTVQD